tara:strand:- start:583 stop:1065 length:483 start_codon:yes stop_codon:yes gene_type:complete
MTFNINYEEIIKDALKNAIKKLLLDISLEGIPGNHYFYISFITNFPGVKIAKWMIKDYPNEMTIVIQNWFENLHVDDKGFSIVLNFKNKPEKLNIPFGSILSFSDPSVNFSLKFEGSLSQNLETIMDTKENDSQPQSFNDDLKSEQNNNIIQFEKYKKLD